ncbi:origin recognition complex subunit 4 [Neocloeon triangulifer]|uniref:origin recognition complex subunit 4 n=1 Tax=Neocloeon triangulifer TaxID=2078957 RepID=UPI00286F3D7D|nr:origin recognition complex subunit 4 [Neocloeon triangulifer]
MPNLTMEMSELDECKRQIRERILRPAEFRGFEEQRKNLLDLIRRAVRDGDSNSALLIGPAGSGKTTLVRSVLQEISKEKGFDKKALVVNLNGLIHTDDRLSLKSMSKQLKLENVIDEQVTGNFAENMALLLSTLNKADHEKALVFILEEVDLFCNHHNQSLLYNLFDLAHRNESSVFVLGVTVRLDVMDRMEKRVRSRFSYRSIYLLPANNAKNFESRVALCQEWLLSDPSKLDRTFCREWNKCVAALLAQNETGYNCIKRLYDMQNSEDSTKELLLHTISRLHEGNPTLSGQDFEKALDDVIADGWLQILDGLSVLELCLVIAMKHLGDVYQGDPVNFEMVYSRYLKFAKSHSGFEDCTRNTVIKAFEHLQALELILPAAGQGAKTQSQYQLYHFQLTPQQVKDAVKRYEELPTEVQQWAEISLV